MRLLIAEDDCVSRRVLEKLLTNWGHEVVIACDGNKAWEIMQGDDPPPMAILDWMMPGIDGVEICRKVRQTQWQIRPYLILLTGRAHKHDLVKGMSAGADDYVAKPFDPEELRVRTHAGKRIIDLQIESLTAMDSLRKQATHDHLTGLRNKAAIEAALRRECASASRNGHMVSVVMVDLDSFKQVNDVCGHQAGDTVLAEVAKRMALTMRSYEDIGRYGGDEFLVVLTGCDLDGAGAMAERLRIAVADQPIEVCGAKLPVTVSLGVACSLRLPSLTQDLLLNTADTAMYDAKRSGRNQVRLADGSDGLILSVAGSGEVMG